MAIERALRGITGVFIVASVALAAAFLLTLSAGTGASAAEPTAVEIMQGAQQAFYYPGADMKVRVTMRLIDSHGGERRRVMSMLRRNGDEGGTQKYFIYFHEPGDVRQMTFLVWKDPVKEDDRWIFIPAIDLIRRIAADDRRSSFVGSDFTYEDISGRDVGSDTHTLAGEEPVGDRPCWRIESVPKEKDGYAKKITWVDRKTFLPLREEYFDAQGELVRTFTADRTEAISSGGGGSYPTVVSRTMKNLRSGHRTEVTFDSIEYDLGLKDKEFSERYLRRPPRSWIQ